MNDKKMKKPWILQPTLISFPPQSLEVLQSVFIRNPQPDKKTIKQLSIDTGITQTRIKSWFDSRNEQELLNKMQTEMNVNSWMMDAVNGDESKRNLLLTFAGMTEAEDSTVQACLQETRMILNEIESELNIHINK